VVVYLTRLPSHGVRTVTALRANAATRGLPILFVGGTTEAVAKAKAKVPAATFVALDAMPGALRRLAGGKG
jgi:D-aminopeptidase